MLFRNDFSSSEVFLSKRIVQNPKRTWHGLARPPCPPTPWAAPRTTSPSSKSSSRLTSWSSRSSSRLTSWSSRSSSRLASSLSSSSVLRRSQMWSECSLWWLLAEGWQSTCVLPPPGGTGSTGSVHYTGLGWGACTLLLTLEYVSFGYSFALCTGTGGTASDSFSECVLPPPPAHDVSVRRPIDISWPSFPSSASEIRHNL